MYNRTQWIPPSLECSITSETDFSFSVYCYRYWRYNEDMRTMDPGYPKPITVWKGIPDSPQGAFVDKANGKTLKWSQLTVQCFVIKLEIKMNHCKCHNCVFIGAMVWWFAHNAQTHWDMTIYMGDASLSMLAFYTLLSKTGKRPKNIILFLYLIYIYFLLQSEILCFA